ncbi:hypothetical protein B0A50_00095 [Salinomyces thailandicus]|uniref:Uncharacterized protein n=1 Tax=Salinomyces thailandicus TaxID=706561 RepID=A0A4U0UHS7_9PEZI|nr:hypothetical protein B0A50_00095 [Salinomyces thailandica]
MRFRGRTASEKPVARTADTYVLPPLGDEGFSSQAAALLGTKPKSERRWTSRQTRQQSGGVESRSKDDQKSLGRLLHAPEALLDTRRSLVDGMPAHDRKGPGLQVWPNTERYNKSASDLLGADVTQPGQHPAVLPSKHSANAFHDFYDPSRHPLHVSQQTSDSAMRDMGLRKGSPMPTMRGPPNDDPTPRRRPLKSAMKKHSDSDRNHEGLSRLRTSSSEKEKEKEKRPRRLDLSQFFPQSRSSSQPLLSPTKLLRSPSAQSNNSGFFPPETVQVHLKRPSATGPFEMQKTLKPASSDSGLTLRPKVFEPDVFDHAKTNVRRPPKGIKNWFDGFDISSDEEEKEVKAPPPLPPPQMEPVELPANEALPSTFSPWAMQKENASKQPHLLPRSHQWGMKPESEQPVLHRKASVDPVTDNLLAIEAAKDRMQERMRVAGQRKNSVDATTINSALSSHAPSQKPPSRLATSRLASQSVLSLSDSDGDGDGKGKLPSIRASVDDASIMVGDASSVNVEKPAQPPRKLQTKRSMPRESTSTMQTNVTTQTNQTNQTSGSIPIRLTDSIPLPEHGPWSTQRQRPELLRPNTNDGAARALRRLEGQRESRSEPARSITKASSQTFDGSPTSEDSGSLPADAAHMMAVTEEEMILLEMMRNKRAMMQKNSFTEGYQQALKREQEQLARRRESARQAAMKYLRQKDGKGASKSQRNSRLTERVERIMEGAEPLPQLDEDIRRKYSALRKEDVDKALKLERFLTASEETPTVDCFPEPPSNLMPLDEKPPQRFELLLPHTYSPAHTPAESQASGSPVLGDEDIESHHDRIREFLASSTPTEEPASFFPAPPGPSSTARSRATPRKNSRRSILSPSPVAEEEAIPQIPSRNPRRPSESPRPQEAGEGRRRSISGRRLSSQIDFGPLMETASHSSAYPAPLRHTSSSSALLTHTNSNNHSVTHQKHHQHSKQQHQRQHHRHQNPCSSSSSSPPPLHPSFDFAPLDFGPQSTACPSLSTTLTGPSESQTHPGAPTTAATTTTTSAASDTDAASTSLYPSAAGTQQRPWTPDTDLASLTSSLKLQPSTHIQNNQHNQPQPQLQPSIRHSTNQKLQPPPTKPTNLRSSSSSSSMRSSSKSTSRSQSRVRERGVSTSTFASGVSEYSAGEDVLAAWADLGGGGTEALAWRRRGR